MRLRNYLLPDHNLGGTKYIILDELPGFDEDTIVVSMPLVVATAEFPGFDAVTIVDSMPLVVAITEFPGSSG